MRLCHVPFAPAPLKAAPGVLLEQLQAAAHEVPDDVAVADEDVDGGLRDLEG